MARFKVLAGLHVQEDKSQKPAEVKDPQGNVTLKYPSRTYKTGEVCSNDVDLVAKHGGDKFQLVGGHPEEYEASLADPAVFPGGQVSSGIQGGAAAETKKNAESDETLGHEVTHSKGRVLSPQERAGRAKAQVELGKKSHAELLEIAKQQSVDIKGATKKEDVIKAILDAD